MYRILCFGDSNTYGYDPRSFSGSRYPSDVRWTGLLGEEFEVLNAAKIQRNIQRDKEVNRRLRAMGWQVLRIWESDIKKDIRWCGNAIEYAYWRSIRILDGNEDIDYDGYD